MAGKPPPRPLPPMAGARPLRRVDLRRLTKVGRSARVFATAIRTRRPLLLVAPHGLGAYFVPLDALPVELRPEPSAQAIQAFLEGRP